MTARVRPPSGAGACWRRPRQGCGREARAAIRAREGSGKGGVIWLHAWPLGPGGRAGLRTPPEGRGGPEEVGPGQGCGFASQPCRPGAVAWRSRAPPLTGAGGAVDGGPGIDEPGSGLVGERRPGDRSPARPSPAAPGPALGCFLPSERHDSLRRCLIPTSDLTSPGHVFFIFSKLRRLGQKMLIYSNSGYFHIVAHRIDKGGRSPDKIVFPLEHNFRSFFFFFCKVSRCLWSLLPRDVQAAR